MSWLTLTAADVTDQFTEIEAATIDAVQSDSGSKLPGIVAKVIAQVRGDIRSGGYDLDSSSTTIPDGLHNDAIAVARWKLLATLPSSEEIQSKERKAENDAALTKFARIASSKYSVEPPTGAATSQRGGNWNSENKILPRTHPIPRPAGQFPADPNHYANPDAPADRSSS